VLLARSIKARRIPMAGHVAGTGNERNASRISKGTSERKGPLGKFIQNWEVNVKKWILE
jgi:hypothetical protein